MGRAERLYAIDRLLRERGGLGLDEFLAALEVSRATFRRDLDYLRDRLHAPIIWDAGERKYRFSSDPSGVKTYALPGVWFNESELHALLAMQQLLENIEPGLLAPHLQPLKRKLISLLAAGKIDVNVIGERIRISPLAKRRGTSAFFEVVASALLNRRVLRVTHYNRHTDETLTREISPQRLIYYRDNWYLDSWCHLRGDLRSFAVDAMRAVIALPAVAVDITAEKVKERFDAGYGVFSGPTTEWAKLRFSIYRARWIASEVWHRDQKGMLEPDGRYSLEIPYNVPRELMADILRQGAECEVLQPEGLRACVAEEVARLHKIYAPRARLKN